MYFGGSWRVFGLEKPNSKGITLVGDYQISVLLYNRKYD